MRRGVTALIWIVVSGASVGLHLAAFGGLGGSSANSPARKRRAASLVEMEVSRPKPPPPPDAPKPPEPRAQPKLAMARPARVTAPQPAVPTPAPPAAETPADFTGVTLTNDGAGPGWASATGNGAAMTGPVGKPGARVTGRSVEGATPAPPREATPIVGVEDLSRPPEAPDLGPALERFYPEGARRKGAGGKAVVRARVMPDGRVRELVVMSETEAGFGSACRETLQGSHWTAPLDRDGKAVSTIIKYTCRFEVR